MTNSKAIKVKCKFCGHDAFVRPCNLNVPFVVVDCLHCGALTSFRDNFGRDQDIKWVLDKYEGRGEQ